MRVLLALTLALAAGCGYTTSLVPRDAQGAPVERVGIRIFDNQSRRPDLERELHAELSAAAHRFVDARLVRPGAADVVIDGSIEEVRRSGGVRTSENQVLESREAVRIEAALIDAASGVVIRRAATFVQVGAILDTPAAGVDARQRAVAVAAERLVLLLLAREDRAASPGEDDGAESGPGPAPLTPRGE